MKQKITRVACLALTLLTIVAALASAQSYTRLTGEVTMIRGRGEAGITAKATTGFRIVEDEIKVMVGKTFEPTCLVSVTKNKIDPVYYEVLDEAGEEAYDITDIVRPVIFKGLKVGTAFLTLGSGKDGTYFEDTVKVSVLAKPDSVTLDMTALEMTVGGSQSLAATVLPAESFQGVTWASSNKAVATVTASGVVTAKKAGSAKITVATANGKKAVAKVKVTKAQATDAKYRALSIGTGFLGYGDSPAKVRKFEGISTEGDKILYAADAREFANMLRLNRFNGAPVSVKQAFSFSTRKAALAAIASAFKGAKDNDVSYLYLMANAVNAEDGTYQIYLSADKKPVSAADLRTALDKIKGTKVVILSASFSGDVVNKRATAAWAQGFTRTFAGPVAKSGELAGEGYKVICGCNRTQSNLVQAAPDVKTAWSLAGSVVSLGAGWNYQNQFAIRSGATDMKADANGDGQVTLAELYDYAAPEVRRLSAEWKPDIAAPTELAVWPENDEFVIFARN